MPAFTQTQLRHAKALVRIGSVLSEHGAKMKFTGVGHQPNLKYSLRHDYYAKVDRVNGIISKQINSLGWDLALTSERTGAVLIGDRERLKTVKAVFERFAVPKIIAGVLTEHGSISPAVTNAENGLQLDYAEIKTKVLNELLSHLQKNIVEAVGATSAYKIQVGLTGNVVTISGEPKILSRTAALLAKMQKKS
ncbi:MAG: hypothetical protein V1817_03530 [Candidatus Micrarchaeota archaeon]